MTFGPNEAVIDEIVASCNGDLRGALKALLMVNEHLEAEIAQLYAAAAHYGRHCGVAVVIPPATLNALGLPLRGVCGTARVRPRIAPACIRGSTVCWGRC